MRGVSKWCPQYFWSRVDLPNDILQCWNWKGSKRAGYGAFRNTNASRQAYIYAFGELSDKAVLVCHHCDNRSCVNPGHLFRGSQSDNMKDCIRKGRFKINLPNYKHKEGIS
jgi:HNH endonuclease